MARFDLVVKGGRVATAGDVVVCDVAVKDGRIARLGDDLNGADRIVDARGRLVLPGGIDTHCHIAEDGWMGFVPADDFASATRAAACGGTTTIVPFAHQQRGKPLRHAVDAYHARAEGKAIVDYAFHILMSDPSDQALGQELPALAADGYTSIKIYMTYEGLKLDDRQILNVLAAARRSGCMVMIHAENDACIHYLTAQLVDAGQTGLANFPLTAPHPVEREATHRAIALGEVVDVPILLVHVSSREAIEQIRWARAKGLSVHGETCPQYVTFTGADFERPGWEAAKMLCMPPPRDRASHDEIWTALAGGVLDVLSSDHSAYRMEGPGGKKHHGPEPHFHRVAPGMPGIETRMPLMFSAGVGQGRIGLSTFVAISAANPAKLYGLYPRKGTIAVGSDADLVLWDPDREVTITRSLLHDNSDYTPYEGTRVKGWPVMTFSRGDLVARDGEVLVQPGRGRFLPCARPLAAQA